MKDHLRIIRLLVREAFTALGWFCVALLELARSPRTAAVRVRCQLREPITRQRVQGWCQGVAHEWAAFRQAGFPIVAGFVAFVWAMLSFEGLAAALGVGFVTWVISHLAVKTMPFVVSFGAPVFMVVCLFQCSLPFDVAEPPIAPALAAKVALSEAPSEPRSPSVYPDPPSESPALEEALNVERTPRPLASRVLDADGSFELDDPDDLRKIRGWIDAVREGDRELSRLRAQVQRNLELNSVLPRTALYELGFMGECQFENSSNLFTLDCTVVEFMDTDGRMHTAWGSHDEDGEPVFEGRETLVMPDGSGRLLCTSKAELERFHLLPILSSGIARDALLELAKRGETDGLASWRKLKEQGFADSGNDNPSGPVVDLEQVEEDLLLGRVQAIHARDVIQLHEDIRHSIAETQVVATLTRTLREELRAGLELRLERIHATEEARRSRRVEARRARPVGPWEDARIRGEWTEKKRREREQAFMEPGTTKPY